MLVRDRHRKTPMVGKNPHRPEGKAAADNEHMEAKARQRRNAASAPSSASIEESNIEQKDRHGGPSVIPEAYEIGGSRAGVPSRVKSAIESRAEREDE